MHTGIPASIITAFTGLTATAVDANATVSPVTNGLINWSFKLSCPGCPELLVQRINQHVFADPELVQENYLLLWNYLEEQKQLHIPVPFFSTENKSIVKDGHGEYWRAFHFIDNGHSLPIAETVAQASAVARTFSGFTASFAEFDAGQLHIILPGFHSPRHRWQLLQRSVSDTPAEKMTIVSNLLYELSSREKLILIYESLIASGDMRTRVMHHDSKISNILFDKRTAGVICPVDFDTVMPGYIFSDLGDMIRSIACNLDEHSTDIDAIAIREGYYHALADAYLSGLTGHLTSSEKEHIHLSGLLMIYMQSLRYLTDYLSGDKYYQTTYAEQNLDRAKNQLALLKVLERFLLHTYNLSY